MCTVECLPSHNNIIQKITAKGKSYFHISLCLSLKGMVIKMNQTVLIEDKQRTQIVAHRGLSGIENENTLLSFVAAANRSYWGIECDVHVTKDGKYIICHDDETARVCERNISIENSNFDELRALKMKESGSKCLPDSIKLPTLSEYLAVCSRYGKFAIIEFKKPMKIENIAEILRICAEEYELNKIIFISIFIENLIKVRELQPLQTVQLLSVEYNNELFETLTKYKFDLDIWYDHLTAENISALHRAGRKVNCWTCDDKIAAEKLISFGVDFITTNILE